MSKDEEKALKAIPQILEEIKELNKTLRQIAEALSKEEQGE